MGKQSLKEIVKFCVPTCPIFAGPVAIVRYTGCSHPPIGLFDCSSVVHACTVTIYNMFMQSDDYNIL